MRQHGYLQVLKLPSAPGSCTSKRWAVLPLDCPLNAGGVWALLGLSYNVSGQDLYEWGQLSLGFPSQEEVCVCTEGCEQVTREANVYWGEPEACENR